jgi:hypothetical protein
MKQRMFFKKMIRIVWVLTQVVVCSAIMDILLTPMELVRSLRPTACDSTNLTEIATSALLRMC